MLRNRMLGGVSSFALMAPDGVDGGGAGDTMNGERHTDAVLLDIASKAFDDVAAGDTAGDTTGSSARATETGADASKGAQPGKDTGQGEKTHQAKPGSESRDDGRDQNGRFAKKAGDPPAKTAELGPDGKAPAAGADQQQLGPDGQPVAQAKAAPPGGWSPASKAAWEKLPANVRDDIAKRELEISNGFKMYEGVKPFAERAKAAGQSLAQALTAYTGIEELIRKDFSSGVMHIAQNAGLTQHEAARAFGTIAQRLGFQFSASSAQPGGGSAGDQKPGAEPDPNVLRDLLKPVLEPILQRVNAIDTTFRSQAEGVKTQRLTESQKVVESFRQDPAHKYYGNVEEQIGSLLETGMVKRTGNLAADLKAAYDMACRMDPEISELLLNERSAAAVDERARNARAEAERARSASRSVSGAPLPGAREQPRRGPGDRLHDVAAAAYDQAAGRV